jgi:DprA winged helix domain
MRAADPSWARLLDHLGGAGPSSADDLKTELSLKAAELRKILYPLELCGAVVTRAIEPSDEGEVEGFEYLRWDQLFTEPAPGDAATAVRNLIVAAVRAAVVAPEREVVRWFPWRWRLESDLVDRLVSEARLERPERGWVAAAASA